jgi:hypothetical protein
MPALVAEHLDHEIGSAVHDLRSVEERRGRIDEAAKPHDPHHLVEVAERDLDLGQKVDCAGARRAWPCSTVTASPSLPLATRVPDGPRQIWPETTSSDPVRTNPT